MCTPHQNKILIVDDHQLFIDGIKALLLVQNAKFYTALSAEEALKHISEHSYFDLILLDIKMPGMSGLSLLRQLKSLKNTSPTLVISAEGNLHTIKDALKQGAFGFVSKESSSTVLRQAINTVMQKQVYLSPTWQFLLDEENPHKTLLDQQGITPRQLEILHLVEQGIANKVISSDLGISENTVKSHLHMLFKTLEVTNRTSCIQKAKDIGIIEV